MIIGITGTLGSGKGTVVDYLIRHGFTHYSVREFLEEEIKNRGLVINRDSMVMIANDLREKYGVSYIVDQLYDRAKANGGNAVIESIRCIGEVESLRRLGDFILIGIDADVELRYTRISERKGSTDLISFDRFVRDEQREMNNKDPTRGNISACLEMADHIFKNNWSVEELYQKIENYLNSRMNAPTSLGFGKPKRPSWDAYFIEIMDAVSRRATCEKEREGCVIARDNQILVTGYSGAPTGLAHCDEVGHQMKTIVDEQGNESKVCVRINHAEQNALSQAAKLGTKIGEATIYCENIPCDVCSKMLVSAGIRRIVARKNSSIEPGIRELFLNAGVHVDFIEK